MCYFSPMALTQQTPLVDVLELLDVTTESRETYRQAFQHVLRARGPRTVAELGKLRPKGLAELVRTMKNQPVMVKRQGKPVARDKPVALASVLLGITVLKRVWRVLHRDELIENDPFASMDPIKVGDNVPRWNVCQPGEIDKLLAHLEKEKEWAQHALVSVLGKRALRIHEALKLTWGNIQWRTAKSGQPVRAFVFQGKGNKEASVAVTDEVWRSLCRLTPEKKQRSEDLVLARDGAEFFSSRVTASRLIARLSKNVLGHRVTAHGLRATVISFVATTQGLEAAQALARHEDDDTTKRYLRWNVVG